MYNICISLGRGDRCSERILRKIKNNKKMDENKFRVNVCEDDHGTYINMEMPGQNTIVEGQRVVETLPAETPDEALDKLAQLKKKYSIQ